MFEFRDLEADGGSERRDDLQPSTAMQAKSFARHVQTSPSEDPRADSLRHERSSSPNLASLLPAFLPMLPSPCRLHTCPTFIESTARERESSLTLRTE
jgi:hypothetical protein